MRIFVMNDVIEKDGNPLDFLGFECFCGGLTELIWLRLIIEDVIFEMDVSTTEITALNVAKEVLTQGNLPGIISTGHLLEACDGYLARYKDVFTDLGYVPYNFNYLDESEENLFAIAARTKSNLFKAHTAELNVHAKKISLEIA
jgi:hypothetical protein